MRIFNSCFLNKIKNERISIAFEKLRLIIWAYNNHGKENILTQSSTIK